MKGRLARVCGHDGAQTPGSWRWRWRWRSGLALVCTVLMACGGGGTDMPAHVKSSVLPTSESIYAFDARRGKWTDNNGRWYTYRQSELPCASGVGFGANRFSPASCFEWLTGFSGLDSVWIRSQGPWWVDPNHFHGTGGDGFGFIHVLAFVQLPGAWQGPLVLNKTTVRFRTRISHDWSRPLAPSRFGLLQGRAYLWFQTSPRNIPDCIPDPEIGENCTRQSNFIYTDHWKPSAALDQTADAEGLAVSVPLNAKDAARWTCLGYGRNVKYDCMPFEQAIEQVAVMGVVQGPVNSCQLLNGADPQAACDLAALARTNGEFFNHGTFEISDFAITLDEKRSTSARQLALDPPELHRVRTGWTSHRLQDVDRLEPGMGIHLIAPADHTPLQLTLSPDAQSGSTRSGIDLILLGSEVKASLARSQLQVLLTDAISRNPRWVRVADYEPGDRVTLHAWERWVLVLKNDEVVYTLPHPCPSQSSCSLESFISAPTGSDTQLELFANASR